MAERPRHVADRPATVLDQIWSEFDTGAVDPVSIYDAKTHLSRIVARAEAGEETVITRHGRPVARVVPLPARPQVRAPGALAGRIAVADDFDGFTDADARDWYGA